MDNPSAQSLTVGSLPEERSWYTLLYDHRTRSACRKRNPRHPAHHHRVAPAELATRLLVDCQLAGTERCAAHRHCRRAERALRNYLETFPFFAAAILVVTVTNTHSLLTVWGANFYFWGRIVYAILYMADWPLARSLVWNIPTIGILMNVAAPFLK